MSVESIIVVMAIICAFGLFGAALAGRNCVPDVSAHTGNSSANL